MDRQWKQTEEYVKDTLRMYESKPKKIWWLADKLFILHVVITFVFAGLLAWAGLWVSAGIVIALWLLTFAIWQEWKNS